jgi:hypothetical protein
MLKPRVSARALAHARGKKFSTPRVTRTVLLRQTARGELTIPVPASIGKVFGAKAGERVWFWVRDQSLVITRRPWGPHPQGRRQSNRLRRAAIKRQRIQRRERSHLHSFKSQEST